MANLNPDNTGTRLVPCASANVSDNGTVVYIGFSFENIADKIGDTFRIVMSPAVGWNAQASTGAVVFGPVSAPPGQAQPQGTTNKIPSAKQPSRAERGFPGDPASVLPSKSATMRSKSQASVQPRRTTGVQSGKATIDVPPEKDIARFNRLAEIALALHDPRSDAEALVTILALDAAVIIIRARTPVALLDRIPAYTIRYVNVGVCSTVVRKSHDALGLDSRRASISRQHHDATSGQNGPHDAPSSSMRANSPRWTRISKRLCARSTLAVSGERRIGCLVPRGAELRQGIPYANAEWPGVPLLATQEIPCFCSVCRC